MKLSREVLKKIPKVDLHCHLDGSVRTATIIELAKKQEVKLPTENIEELNKYVQVSPDCRSLAEFLKAFDFFYPLLKNPYAVEKIAYEICDDCRNENIKYFETRFAPALQVAENFNQEEVVKTAISGLAQGCRDFGIKAGIILCCYRMVSDSENWETVELAKKYHGKGVVGIDLAGDEVNYPTDNFVKFLEKARDYKIPITCHIGETAAGSGMKNVFDIPVQRIGHGIHLSKSKTGLLERVKKEGIPLEMCITSNVQTHVVDNFESHPLKKFYDSGIKVTINTDDRAVSGIDLTNEYDVAVNRLGFDISDLIKIIHNGISALFIPNKNKVELSKTFEAEISKLKVIK